MSIHRHLIYASLLLFSQFFLGAMANPMYREQNRADTQVVERVSLTHKPAERLDLYIALGGKRKVDLTNLKIKAAKVDPAIADVQVTSPCELLLTTRAAGGTEIVLTAENGEFMEINLSVLDYGALQATLKCIDPRISFNHQCNDGNEQLVLHGNVEKPEAIIKAYSAALVFMDDRGINSELDDGTIFNRNASSGLTGSGCGGGSVLADPRYQIGASKLFSDGRRVLSLLTIETPQQN